MIDPSSARAVAANTDADDGVWWCGAATLAEVDTDKVGVPVLGSDDGGDATAIWYFARASSAWARSVCNCDKAACASCL